MKRIIKIKHKIIEFLNNKFPDPTPEQTIEDDAKVVDSFIKDENNRDKAILVAQGIQKDFKHWFTIKQLIKKYNTEQNAIEQQLRMLVLFKLCNSKINGKGKIIFKICLSTKDRLKVLYDRFEEVNREKGQIALEIKKLEDK